MSSSNRVRLAWVKEANYGVTPADPTFKRLRFTSENLNVTPEVAGSEEIREDRIRTQGTTVGLATGGDVNFQFSAKAYDAFLEAALCETTWDNTPAPKEFIQTGVEDNSFSILKSYMDVGVHILYRGQRVNTFSLAFAFKQRITGTVGFVGAGYQMFDTDADLATFLGSGTVEDAELTQPMSASTDIKRLLLDGNPSDVCWKTIQFNINNGMEADECLGSDAPKDQIKGDSDVNGNVELAFTRNSYPLLKDSLDQSQFELGLECIDGESNSYLFEIPGATIQVPTPSAGGRNQTVLLSGTWQATLSAAENTDVRVTRELTP